MLDDAEETKHPSEPQHASLSLHPKEPIGAKHVAEVPEEPTPVAPVATPKVEKKLVEKR